MTNDQVAKLLTDANAVAANLAQGERTAGVRYTLIMTAALALRLERTLIEVSDELEVHNADPRNPFLAQQIRYILEALRESEENVVLEQDTKSYLQHEENLFKNSIPRGR